MRSPTATILALLGAAMTGPVASAQSDQPQVQTHCGDVPIKRFGFCWVLGEGPNLLLCNALGFKQGQNPGQILGPADAQGNHGQIIGTHDPKGDPLEIDRISLFHRLSRQGAEGWNELHRPLSHTD